MALSPDLAIASSYFENRLLASRAATQLPASAQFDLARSPLSDDELEDIVDQFRDTPQPREGWGIAPMLSEVLSSQPKTVPTQDLQKLQQNLIAQGYSSPDQQATGTWDPSWYAALRRFDRDNYEKQRAGYHWYSAPTLSAVNAMTNTLPSRVFQGIVGAAKGLIFQAPESAERLGVLGSAATGAGIGAIVGGPVGALVGGGVGAIGGILAETFFDDEEGEDEQGIGAFLEVLAPWGEYQRPQELWEDLGFVLSAASMVSGVGAAAKGIGAGVKGLQAARAGTVAVGDMTGMAPQGLSLGRALLQPGAKTELGVFGSIARAATRKFPTNTPLHLLEKANKLSPIAFMHRTGPKMALDVFGGISQAQMGARMFGGIGQGSKQKFLEAKTAMEAELGRDLTEDEMYELSKKTATSTIEKEIANAPRLESGIDIPLVGDAVDIAAFALYPQRLLPFGGGRAIGQSAERLMGNTSLGPFVHAQIMGRNVGYARGRTEVLEQIQKNPGLVPYMRLGFGIDVEASKLVDAALKGRGRPARVAEAWRNARASVIQKLHELPEEEGRQFAEQLIGYSHADETAFTAHLTEITAQGSGANAFGDFAEATRATLRIEKEVGENTRYIRDDAGEIVNARAEVPVEPHWETFQTPAGPVKQKVTSQNVPLGGVSRGTRSNIDTIQVEQAITRAEQRLQQLERVSKRTAAPADAALANSRKILVQSEIKRLKSTLKTLKQEPEVQIDRFRITPAREDYMTAQMARARKAEYAAARKELIASADEAATNPMRQEVAAKNHDILIENLLKDGIIDEVTAARARKLKPSDIIEKQIDDYARGVASDVELPEHLRAMIPEGYKPVTAGDDVLSSEEVGRFVNLDKYDAGDYTRRAAIWETLAMSPKLRTDKSLFKLRRQTELAEVQNTLTENGIRLTAGQAFRRLQDYMEKVNHEGSIIGPGIFSKSGRPRLYKVDPRDLNVDDIYKAFEDVPGFTDVTAKELYGALRRGAAYGHELRLLHPIDSAHAAGQLLRINGLPGFSDLVRTWHLKAPNHFDRGAWRIGEVRYKPRASSDKAYDLAHSVERSRMERALFDTARNNNIPAQQRDLGMMLMDNAAETAVRQGRFQSVDEFYKHLDVAYAEKYVDVPSALERRANEITDSLFRRVADAPRTKGPEKAVGARTPIWEKEYSRLQAHLAKFEDTPSWYENSAAAFHRLFAGSEITLRNGKSYPLEDVVARIVAETSGSKYPTDNLASALKAVRTFLEDKSFRHVDIKSGSGQGYHQYGKNVYRKVDQILDGDFPDTAKYGPFFRAVKGQLDEVVVDRRMAVLFGIEHASMTPVERDFIANTVKDLAKRAGIEPGHAQERLWMAFNDIVDENLALARRQGDDEAVSFYEGVARVNDDASQDYGVLIDQNVPTRKPKNKADQPAGMRDLVEGTFGEIDENGALKQRLFQQAADDVAGLAAWGDDGLQAMRFFRSADFTTLVHENAHLLRRLIAPEDLNRLERAMGLSSGTAAKVLRGKPVKLLDMRKPEWKTGIKGVVKKTLSDADGDGGATFNPRTGEMFDPKPGTAAVAIREGTDMVIPAGLSEEEIGQRLSKFAQDHRKELQDPETFLGTWRNEDGTIDVDVSEVGLEDRVKELAASRGQKAVYSFTTSKDVPIAPNGVWDEAAEERFAEMAEQYVLRRTSADPEVKGMMGPVHEALRTLWGNLRGQAVDSNYIPRGMRKELDKLFPIPESFAPPSLSRSAARGAVNRQTLGGAAIGGAAGAYEGREDGILDSDIVAGAMYGAAGGLLARKAGKRNYGYLPDSLMRLNTALRYSLSFTFDLGRFTEQNMIAMAKHQLPPMASPTKYVRQRQWKSPYSNGKVGGQQAWDDAVKFWDELNGTNIYASIDDMDRRLFQKGMLGFSPRNWEVAQAFQLYQRGWGAEKIAEAISEIGRYGVGRTAAEKSANFVVFPFSFSKKFLTTLSDFILQAPGRNLLLHEGVRRYYESEADEKVSEFLERRAPFLQELAGVNSLAFGISPGRFFLQGLSDHRTLTGTAAQAISSFFVPSGAATSLAQAAGNAADLAVNAFVPVVITGESINKAGGIEGYFDVMRRYVPFIREMDQYFVGAGQIGGGALSRQVKAFMEGGDPYWQFTQYQEGLKLSKAALEPMALAMGYSSVDGLLASDAGAGFVPMLENEKERLRQEMPTGFQMSQTFENQDALNAAGLMDLAQKPNRSEAEDRILSMFEKMETWNTFASTLGLDAEGMANMQAQQLRTEAMKYVNDPRFVELWDRFFLRDYGPIRRVA